MEPAPGIVPWIDDALQCSRYDPNPFRASYGQAARIL